MAIYLLILEYKSQHQRLVVAIMFAPKLTNARKC